ncbi:AtzE family amidohydrolase [Vacuolonema iberomarrocanum]|uniref:AtzE family amidohydrolase n=1 Tax=Vacuolonema iberomarrocanum TaxID=3454632 RepID=UPI0019F7D9E6|nr:AtzE family amidohydrolase [filamentous cyanobacterium LEGE 07170]
MQNWEQMDAIAITTAVQTGETTARAVTEAALQQIEVGNPALNAFTEVLAEQALASADAVDGAIAQGKDAGPLAGVPFAVKDLYDVSGMTTLAGSKINRDNPPATQDATAVARLKQAGAILVGTLHMDEYAYGFVTINSHYGATYNPHDVSRVAGGSSGGSAAAVAGGLIPLSLGTDTNGSIRVPASLCGILGLKPTYGRLSRAGVALFSTSLDHVGPFARSVRDIAASFDAMQGADLRDPICTERSPEPTLPQLPQGLNELTIAVADDHFATGASPDIFAALETVAKTLNAEKRVTIPEAKRARAAAYIITSCEGTNLHFSRLKERPMDFDPATRDRFLSGAFIPGHWYTQAQRFRRWYRDRVRELFEQVDLILAPTTPCVAPKLEQQTLVIDGEEVLLRPNLGLYTQPLSFIGLPVLSVPVQQPDGLPIGIQIIAAPYQEAKILRAAAVLEAAGVIAAPAVVGH